MESGCVVHDRVSITHMGHSTSPYPSLSSGPSCPIDLGDPLAPDLPRWLEGWVQGALTGYVQVESRSIVRDRVDVTRMGHPTAPYPSLGSGLSHPINLGDPLA